MSYKEIRTTLLGKEGEELLESLYKIYLNHRKEEEFYKEVIKLHNEKKIDIIFAFKQISRNVDSYDFFMLQHFLEKILVELDYDYVEPVMEILKNCMLLATGNMSSGLLVNPFIEFCKKDKKRIEEALDISLKNLDEEVDFISIVLTAGLEVNFEEYYKTLQSLITSHDELTQIGAIRALGKLYSKNESRNSQQSFKLLKKVIYETNKQNIREITFKSLCRLLITDDALEKKGLIVLDCLLSKPTDVMMFNISEVLFYEKKELSKNLEEYLWEQLKNINKEHAGTIQNIDYTLCNLVEKDEKKAIKFFEILLLENSKNISIENFSGFKSEIIGNRDVLNYLVTKWLLSKKIILCNSVYELIPSSENGVALSIDKRLALLLKEEDYIFLARKACGYLFTKEVSAISYIISLIDMSPNEKASELENLMFNPILINYSGKTRKYLESIYSKSSLKVKESIDKVIKKLDEYISEINNVDDIAELHPTSKQKEVYSRYWNDLFNAKDYEPKGFFSSFFKKTVILYGNSSIAYIQRNSEEKGQRQEIPMNTYSISTELPRMNTIDPITLDYKLRVFKIEGCEK